MLRSFDLILLEVFIKEFPISQVVFLIYVKYSYHDDRGKSRAMTKYFGYSNCLIIWGKQKVSDEEYYNKEIGREKWKLKRN